MQTPLFGELAPVTPRWTSPGDLPKVRRQVRRTPDQPRAARKQIEPARPHNPYRERIADPVETEFRHERWQGQRDKVMHAMADAGTSPSAMQRMQNCGAECLVEWSEELQRYRLRASYCRCRHCRPCAKAKGGLIAKNLKDRLAKGATKEGDRFRFITLTLRHSTAPLLDQVKELYRHFRVLRRSKFWQSSQRGGAAMLEVGLNPKGEWHPHLHIIGEGDFLKQDRLANHWMKITGGSFKVDVRAIASGKDAAAYVAKYVAKGTSDAVWNDHAKAVEWIVSTRGLRSCATYGTWRGFKLLGNDPAEAANDWKPIGLLTRIFAAAAANEEWAKHLFNALEDALQYDPERAQKKQPQPPA